MSVSVRQLAAFGLAILVSLPAVAQRRPNIVYIMSDDHALRTIGAYSDFHPTPNLDRIANEGAVFRNAFVANSICGPSRAAILTGKHGHRNGITGNGEPWDSTQAVFPRMLQQAGYQTALFGKWHLGHRPGLMPNDQGFDTYYGVPYSNDMSAVHRRPGHNYNFRLPLMRDREVLEWEPDQRVFTRNYTQEAVAFIEENKDEPFFVYLPHSMPHIPLYASEDFEGTSPRGLYGDVIEEIDWSVGQIVATLEAHGLTENTLVFFTSDNGPWLPFKQDGGSAGLLRGGKGSNWEGGQRVPAIVAMPGTIPPGTLCREVVTTMDLLPTIAALTGATLSDRRIDGHDITPLLTGEDGATSPTDAFLYYTSRGELAGIRQGPWKLLLEPGELYHLDHDPSEQYNLANRNADRVTQLRELATQIDAEITEHARPTRVVEEMLFDPRKPE